MTDDDSEGPSIDSLLRDAGHIAPIEVEPDRLGQQLGRFRIDEVLGRGGMGIVYGAEDVELGRRVALKVLPRAAVADDQRRRRFLREARTAASVSHPNIAAVFDVGEAEGTVFLAMELVRGQTLRAAIAAHPQGMPVAEATRIARAVARGLGKAHARGVVHRDLKPENVMMDEGASPKIVDFGLAKLEASSGGAHDLSTQDGKILGTPSYMAPEQAKGSRATPAADVFSLGIVLYEMLTSTRPFGGASLVDVLVSIARDVPEAPSKKAPRVPRDLDRIVMKCLAKDPEARYADGDALAAALEIESTTTRRPWIGWTLAAVAVVAGSSVALVSTRNQRGVGPDVQSTASAISPVVTSTVSAPEPSATPSLAASPSVTGPASAPPNAPLRPPAPRASATPAPVAASASAPPINPLARQK